MIGSTDRQSTLTSMASESRTLLFKVVWCVGLCTVLMLAGLSTTAFARSSRPGIQVQIPNIKNTNGNITCGIFESSEGFPADFLSYAKVIMIKKIQEKKAQCYFPDISPDTYAIAVVHDEDMNGALGTNWFGIPTEGYGFSNTTIDEFGAPAFSAASFRYDGKKLNLTVKLEY